MRFFSTLFFLLLIALLSSALAHAAPSDATSPFEAVFQADLIVFGKGENLECEKTKPLACTLSLTHENQITKTGLMRPNDTWVPPTSSEKAIYFLTKNSTHPYQAVWAKKSIHTHLLGDPTPLIFGSREPWAPALRELIRSPEIQSLELKEDKKKAHTLRFILGTLSKDPSLPLKDPLPFLESTALFQKEDPGLIALLSTLILKLPEGSEAERIRFLRVAASRLDASPIAEAFLNCAQNEQNPIAVRLEAATLLEKIGKGPRPEFYRDLLASRDPKLIEPTLRALADKKSEWGADMLYFAIRDLDSFNLEKTAVDSLLKMGKAYALPRLEKSLPEAREPTKESLLLNGLGQTGSASSVPLILPYLNSDNDVLLISAIKALERINTPEAREAATRASQTHFPGGLGESD